MPQGHIPGNQYPRQYDKGPGTTIAINVIVVLPRDIFSMLRKFTGKQSRVL